jgi:hypothetical protein
MLSTDFGITINAMVGLGGKSKRISYVICCVILVVYLKNRVRAKVPKFYENELIFQPSNLCARQE